MTFPRTSRLLAGLLLGVVAVALSAGPALGHASLTGVKPASGSTVTRPPDQVVLTFDEAVRSPAKIVVKGPSGRHVDHGETQVVDNRVRVAVTMRAVPTDVGRYVIAYRVVSDDGHPVSGESSFEFRPPGVSAAAPTHGSAASGSSDSSRTWWVVGAVAVIVVAALLLLTPLRRGRR